MDALRAGAWTERLLVALAFGRFPAQLGRDDEALNLRERQLREPLSLSTDREIVRRSRDRIGESVVQVARFGVHGCASYASLH